MTLAEIKRAIEEGLRVCWMNQSYEVVRSEALGEYFISCPATGSSIRLTHADGRTLNGKEEEFFVLQE